MSDEQRIEMPCLGRTFYPGMLYDCRSDQVIPTLTLWRQEKLKDALHRENKASSESKVIIGDTLSEKSAKLDLDASLKLSLMSGLLSVNGSARYLNDRKQSSKQMRVSLKYSTTSHVDSLTMEHFGHGDLEYSEVFEKVDATHVVIAVTYGIDAVFVFDQDVDSSDDSTKANGDLKVGFAAGALGKLTGANGGEIKVDYSDGQKELYSQVECKFFGDFHLEKSPCNLLEAINVYRELPATISKAMPVPKMACLYPLSKLDSRAKKLLRQVSVGLVTQTEQLLEALQDVEIKANDIQQSCHPMFEGLKGQMDTFKQYVTEFARDFRQQLVPLLPKIRGGEEEEALVKLLSEVERSPLAPTLLQRWIKEKESEVNILNNMVEQLTSKLNSGNVTIATSRSTVEKVFHNFNNKLVLALVFNVGGKPDLFLNQLKNYLRVERRPSTDDPDSLFQPGCNILKISMAFTNFVENNLDNKAVQFVVYAEEPKIENPYAHIQLYRQKKGTTQAFVPPSAPGKPTVQLEEVNPESPGKVNVEICWEGPEEGLENVQSYVVQYLGSSAKGDWSKSKQHKTQDTNRKASISLEVRKESYVFRVRAVCEAGDGEFGDPSDLVSTIGSETTDGHEQDGGASVDYWVSVSHNSPFPAHAVRALDRELVGGDSTTSNSYVAIWRTKLNRASFGRAHNNNGLAEAFFPWAADRSQKGYIEGWLRKITGEMSSKDKGDFQILTNPGGDGGYRWVKMEQLSTEKGVTLVSVDGLCPAVVTVSGIERLGMADPAASMAWTTNAGKEIEHKGAAFNECLVLVRDA